MLMLLTFMCRELDETVTTMKTVEETKVNLVQVTDQLQTRLEVRGLCCNSNNTFQSLRLLTCTNLYKLFFLYLNRILSPSHLCYRELCL